jgi:hypothetical protein
LWKIDSDIKDEDISAALADLKVKYRAIDSAFYINPENLKSIPEISHAHIILRVDIPEGKWHRKLIYPAIGIVGAVVYCQFLRNYLFLKDAKLLYSHFSLLNAFRFSYKHFLPFPFRFAIQPVLRLLKFKADIQ